MESYSIYPVLSEGIPEAINKIKAEAEVIGKFSYTAKKPKKTYSFTEFIIAKLVLENRENKPVDG